MRGGIGQLQEMQSQNCPNAKHAKTIKKQEWLHRLSSLVGMARIFPGNIFEMHAFFLSSVESLQAIFSSERVGLPTPQSMKYPLF